MSQFLNTHTRHVILVLFLWRTLTNMPCVLVSLSFCLKCLRPGWVKPQALISHSSGSGKSKIKTPADSVPKEAFLGLQTAAFSLCPHTLERQRALVCLLPEDTSFVLGAPPSHDSSELNSPQNAPPDLPIFITLRVRPSAYEF